MRLNELHYIQLMDEARQALVCKDKNAIFYLKEIENRLSTGEAATARVGELEHGETIIRGERNYWKQKADELEKEVERLKKFIENGCHDISDQCCFLTELLYLRDCVDGLKEKSGTAEAHLAAATRAVETMERIELANTIAANETSFGMTVKSLLKDYEAENEQRY
jgi:hypothetical protein